MDPNLLAILLGTGGLRGSSGIGGNRLPAFTGGAGLDPGLGALLVSAGLLPRRRDTGGNYILPDFQGPGGAGQSFGDTGGSATLGFLTGQRQLPQRGQAPAAPSFPGLDAYAALQNKNTGSTAVNTGGTAAGWANIDANLAAARDNFGPADPATLLRLAKSRVKPQQKKTTFGGAGYGAGNVSRAVQQTFY